MRTMDDGSRLGRAWSVERVGKIFGILELWVLAPERFYVLLKCMLSTLPTLFIVFSPYSVYNNQWSEKGLRQVF